MDKTCFRTGRLAYKNTSSLPAFYHNNCWGNASTLTEHTGWMRNLQTTLHNFFIQASDLLPKRSQGYVLLSTGTGLGRRHVNRSIAFLGPSLQKVGHPPVWMYLNHISRFGVSRSIIGGRGTKINPTESGGKRKLFRHVSCLGRSFSKRKCLRRWRN